MLFILIPTHNRWSEARITLTELFRSDYQDFEVVLIDDGSSDGTSEYCRSLFPQVHIIRGDGNLWWSGAINKGLEYALSKNPEFILLMNDDTRVERRTISRLIEVYNETSPRSIICSRVKSTLTGNDEWTGEPANWNPLLDNWIKPDLNVRYVQVEHPPGGRGILIPAECFKNVGIIDQDTFPHYWADHDYHFRAMAKGYKYYLATNAVIWNVPNPPPRYIEFSFRWSANFLLSRRSAMNVFTLRRLLKRHLSSNEYNVLYYQWLKRTILWLMLGVLRRQIKTNIFLAIVDSLFFTLFLHDCRLPIADSLF